MAVILYVEDDSEHRTMLRVILKYTDANITLVEAGNGREALRRVKERPPDLIVLDLLMPELDGFGVMELLKADPNTRHIPIIVLSAWLTTDNRERAKNIGVTDFIAKPYDPLDLVERVNCHLSTN